VDFVGSGVATGSRYFVVAKDESCTLINAIEQIGKQVADGFEDRVPKIRSQNYQSKYELHQEPPDDNSWRDPVTIGTQEPRDAQKDAQT